MELECEEITLKTIKRFELFGPRGSDEEKALLIEYCQDVDIFCHKCEFFRRHLVWPQAFGSNKSGNSRYKDAIAHLPRRAKLRTACPRKIPKGLQAIFQIVISERIKNALN